MHSCTIYLLIGITLGNFLATPLYSGTDDDCDDDGLASCDIDLPIPIPVIFPDLDGHRGRALIRLPGTAVAKPLAKGSSAQLQKKDDVMQNKLCLNQASKGDAKVITMDHGSANDPFLVCDHGLYHLGALLGIGVIDPHTFIQGSILTKIQHTRGRWSHRWAHNYAEAKEMEFADTPEDADDFKKWNIGDWTRKNGIMSLTLYAGPSWFTADVRAGVALKGIWSRHIQKISDDLIRISFTKEKESAPLVRAQLVPLQKSEMRSGHLNEESYVYLFDLRDTKQKEALHGVLKKNMLPAQYKAEEYAENNEATLLTTREIKRKRKTVTPFQGGVPFLVRYRISKHKDMPSATIVNKRNGDEADYTHRAYLRQKMYRHINVRKPGDDKRRKYFTHTHEHYNRSYAGTVVERFKGGDRSAVSSSKETLNVEISYSHDNPKVKKVNKHMNNMFSKIGVNDFRIDTGFHDEDERIGFFQIVYKLKVDARDLLQLHNKLTLDNTTFATTAHGLVDAYFNQLKDPHNYCEMYAGKENQYCIESIEGLTVRSLGRIEKLLGKYETASTDNDNKKTAKYLAKIAKELSTNHFVLHSFISSLPDNAQGYGKVEIYGESFLARKINTDPNAAHVAQAAGDEASDDEVYSVDWGRIDAGEEGNDWY